LASFNAHGLKIFESLGAGMLEKMAFRDVWVFTGMKGISGHSLLEEVCQLPNP